MGFLNCSWKNMWSLLGWVIYPVCSHLSVSSLGSSIDVVLGFFISFRMALQKFLGSFLPHLKKMLHWLSVSKLLFLGAFLCSVLTGFVWFELNGDWIFVCRFLPVGLWSELLPSVLGHMCLTLQYLLCLRGCCPRAVPPVVIPKGISSSPASPTCPVLPHDQLLFKLRCGLGGS